MTTHFKTILLVVGVSIGIVVGERSIYSSEIAIASVLLSGAQAVLMLVKRRGLGLGGGGGERKTESFSLALFTILFSLGIFFGIIRTQLVVEKTYYICESSCTFSAKIISSPETKNDYQTFNVRPDEATDEVLDVQIKTPLYPKYAIGDRLEISGKVVTPDIVAPHGNKKSFDYASYLLTKNVGSEMTYPGIKIIDEDSHTMNDVLGRWKENMVDRMSVYISSPASSLASGMLFGNSSMPKELTQTFRVAGLSHIIVLSGFNIAIVISFILFAFAFLPLVLRIVLASTSVIFFVMMVGGEASVIRATLMAFIALLATFIGREYVAKQALVISLLLIVMYEPYALLHDVSLHLSFLATAGIVYLSEPFSVILKKYSEKYFSYMTSETFQTLLATTLSAYVITLPYIMYTFGTVSIYALLANILVLPFVPIAMLISFLVVSSSYATTLLAALFGLFDSVILNVMIWIAQKIEYLPFSYLTFQITFLEMCVMYVFLLMAIKYLVSRKIDETKSTTVQGFLTDTIPY